MKALLQQVETGLYFHAPGEWTPEHQEARDFKSSVTARTYCLRHGIEGVQIVLKFESEKYDIVLPSRQSGLHHE
ncbi:MAG TPA: hypothetical protein VG754_09060 [Verrucomicrobiae bacterium]|nr:hypothetical protein [Verrucomicrobiae bacterium]